MKLWIPLFAACTFLVTSADERLECGAGAVTDTLSSMVRDRVLRVASDAYPTALDAARKLALTRATRITPRDARLLEWDKGAGRLACVTRVVIDAPGPEQGINLRSEAVLHYRVTRDLNEVFFVEVAYRELLNVFPSRAPGS